MEYLNEFASTLTEGQKNVLPWVGIYLWVSLLGWVISD
jgi:hypothetical protein